MSAIRLIPTFRHFTVAAGVAGLALLGGCVSEPSRSEAAPVSRAASTSYYPQWMATAPYAPVFHVLDTESSLGPYAQTAKTITLEDLVKMHGHPCDGLVTAASALSVGLHRLYPDGIIDRTDTGCITNNSPCYGDVAEYLTGGRIRFGTQKIDPSLGSQFILMRFSTGMAVEVTLKPGIFPREVASLETQIRHGHFSIEEMRRCQELEWDYAKSLISRPLEQSFEVEDLKEFHWVADPYVHQSARGDIVNKDILVTHGGR